MNNCYDAIGVFLCIHILYKFKTLSVKRGSNVLNSYYDTLLNILWPRFEYIMNAHINSIVEIDTTKLQSIDCRPHYVNNAVVFFVSFNKKFFFLDHS